MGVGVAELKAEGQKKKKNLINNIMNPLVDAFLGS